MAAGADYYAGYPISPSTEILNVASGWAAQEFAALHLPFEDRGPMSEESLAAIRDALHEEQVSFDGRFAGYRDVATGPAVRPPIWVGGTAPAVLRRTSPPSAPA